MKIYHTDPEKEWLSPERCHIIEIMKDEACKDISVARARVEPGIKTQLHALSNTDEIYYVLQGSGIMTIEKVTARLSEGDCIRIKADQSQSIFNDGPMDLIFLCICQPSFREDCYVNLEE